MDSPPTDITCRVAGGAGVGAVIGNGYVVYVAVAVPFASNTAVTNIDTTVTQDVALTGQFATSNAGNLITCTNLNIVLL